MIWSAVLVQRNGRACSFQTSIHFSRAAWSASTEQDTPRSRQRRCSSANQRSSGRTAALLQRSPLRTGRARFPGNRLKQALWLADRQKCWSWADVGGQPTVAVGVDQAWGGGFVRLAVARIGGDR